MRTKLAALVSALALAWTCQAQFNPTPMMKNINNTNDTLLKLQRAIGLLPLSGTNLLDNTVSSNKLDAPTRALLGAANPNNVTNQDSRNLAFASVISTNLSATNLWTRSLVATQSVLFTPTFINGLAGTNIVTTNLDNETFLNIRMGMLAGNVFSNVNRYGWGNLQRRIQNKEPFTVMLCQDGLTSVALLGYAGLGWFTNIAPAAGVVLGEDFPWWYNTVSGSASNAIGNYNSMMPFGFTHLWDVGGTAIWQGGVTNPAMDYAFVSFLEDPGNGGNFGVYTQLNNPSGPFTLVVGLDNVATGNGTSGVRARWVEWTNSSALPTAIMVSNSTAGKSVKILSVGFKNRTISNGFYLANWSGSADLGWSNRLGTNMNITGQLWRKANPSVVFTEALTFDGGTDIAPNSEPYIQKYLDGIQTNLPRADHILCGVYPGDNTTQQSTNENRMRTNALYRGLSYFDGYNAMGGSMNVMFGRIFSDPTNVAHALPQGALAYDRLAAYWFDFYSTPKPVSEPFWYTNKPALLYDFSHPTANGVNLSAGSVIKIAGDLSGNAVCADDNGGQTSGLIWTNNFNFLRGNSWAEFFGANNYLFTSNISFHVDQPFTVYAVVRFASVAGNAVLASTNNVSNQNFLFDDSFVGDMAGSTLLGYTVQSGVWYIMEVQVNGASSAVYTNGVICASGGTIPSTLSLHGVTLGAGQDHSGKLVGGIAFLEIYPRIGTAYDRANMLRALNDRYGVFRYP